MKKIFPALLILLSAVFGQTQQPDGAELQLAINKLSVVGSVLYIAAHPDDENTALLSYFAKGKLYRTGYLSVTRGEGGQNALGSELGLELGIIRTQELLAARRIDGAEQFFTRAIDFGYSKSSDESLRLWNKDSILSDVVFVIRTFRPDIIITRFSPTLGGHGQHLASAILAQEAYKISGDANVFPEQLKFVQPWKAKRILFNHFRFGATTSNPQNLPSMKLDVGSFNPLLGRSYTELAGIGRTMHKSQAMGSAQNKGSNINEFVVTDGAAAANDIMEGIDITWNRFPNGKKLARMADDLRKKFDPASPEKIIPSLISFRRELQKLQGDPLIGRKIIETESLIRSCAGLWIEAAAQKATYSRGDSVTLSMTFLNRSSLQISLASLTSPQLKIDFPQQQILKFNEPFLMPVASIIAKDERLTQPYWLLSAPKDNRYSTVDFSFLGSAENPSPLSVNVTASIEKELIVFRVPVMFKWIDDIDGEKYRAVSVVPPVSVNMTEKNIVGKNMEQSILSVQVKALKENISGTVRVNVPQGWNVSRDQTFAFTTKDQEKLFQFSLRPDSTAQSNQFSVEAVTGGEAYSQSVKTIAYPHIPPQTVMEPAKGTLLHNDVKKIGRSVGYIMGAGDEVPKALEQMGYAVTMITDEELRNGDLQHYDAIVAGVRSYNTRTQLRQSNNRLLEYVEKGGTYVVQYQVVERGLTDNIAPFPMEISRDRVTDENAAVSFTDANHPLLNYPNRISADDFTGWVQERGLYFANKRDAKYETVLSCADPNEKPQDGSLLYTKYGKGIYIFTGLSFFRQLPAGVEGAYRLFANLVSAGK